MEFYTFKNKEMPWGDYGDTLYTGFAYRNKNDILCLERAGTFVPPIYEVALNILIVTDETKQKLEDSGLKGFTFSKAAIKKVVDIDWMSWDFEADEPTLYPHGGEPENYIKNRKHNVALADKVPMVWEVTMDNKTLVGRKQCVVESSDELFIIENSWSGSDIFTSEGCLYIFFSAKARAWLEENLKEYAVFEKFNSKIGTAEEIDFALDYIKPIETKSNPYAHLTEKDWKDFQRLLRQAEQYIEKQRNAKTEKSKEHNRTKAIESFKMAESIRPLPKKEQQKMESLQTQNR